MSRPYRIIFFLLTFSVLSVLALQGYYIYNSYNDRSKQFDSRVYAALGEIGRKINERRDVKILKEQIFTVRVPDPIPSRVLPLVTVKKNKGLKQRVIVVEEKREKKVHTKKNDSGFFVQNLDSIMLESEKTLQHTEKAMQEVNRTLRTLKRDLDTQETVRSVILANSVLDEDSSGVDAMLNKMFREIRLLNTEENNADSLQKLITPILENNGIFIPYEFAIKDLNDKDEKLLVKSKGFNNNARSYRSDLSAERTFNNGQFIFIQLPAQASLLFAEMKTSLILSLIFTLIILSAFFYTLRLILQQKKLSDVKNDFVNNMTHELKTPIATISLAVDAMNNPLIKRDEDKYNEYTRILKEENQKLNQHVERVLQLSLLEKGELHLNKRPIDLAAIVESVINNFKLLVAQKNAKIVFNPTIRPVTINADADHITAVIRNLIDNALKYSGDNPEISISLSKTNEQVVLSVKDNGIGIEKDKQQKVFDKFYRVQGGELHDVKGFGLGLSYVRNIVEAHGGSILVKSELNKGSEFMITLPGHD